MPKLFYVVGASGSGKDSILKQVKVQTGESHHNLVVAHRYVTRHTDMTEGSVYLTEAEFELREQHHLFALHWQANHYRYGVGAEINQWLQAGLSVVVNGSREYWPTAKKNYGDSLYTITIDVPESVLQQRLRARNRETESDIAMRLKRNSSVKNSFVTDATITNDISLEHAVSQFLDITQSIIRTEV